MKTVVDWWAFRSKAPLQAHETALGAIFSRPVTLRPRRAGYLGYERSAVIVVGELEAGVHAWGGENQRGWSYTSISGQGCAWIDDWDRAQEVAQALNSYEAKRVDLALDVFDGSVTFDTTLYAYRSGGFTLGGRPPKCEPMRPERDEDSAIITIGNRASDKYLRGYEKGKQQLGPAIASAVAQGIDLEGFRLAHIPRQIDGELVSVSVWDWWRLELELKPKSAPLPEDVIDLRDQYFAGAYPYLGQVLPGVQAEALVMRRERGPQLELALALQTVRAQYGNTLFTALVAHHGDILAVWDKIVGKRHNQRLVAAGALMVDHD